MVDKDNLTLMLAWQIAVGCSWQRCHHANDFFCVCVCREKKWLNIFVENNSSGFIFASIVCVSVFFSIFQKGTEGFWKSVARRVPRDASEIRILNPYFIQEAAFQFIGLPFNNGLMGKGVRHMQAHIDNVIILQKCNTTTTLLIILLQCNVKLFLLSSSCLFV